VLHGFYAGRGQAALRHARQQDRAAASTIRSILLPVGQARP